MSICSVPPRTNNGTPDNRRGSFVIAAGSANNALQQVPQPNAAAAARGRSHQLRPIDSSAELSAVASASSGSGFQMMISGAKTGEEKIFSAVEVREARGNNNAADAQARRTNRSTSNVASDADRIRKLEQELRKSQEQVRKKTSEIETLKEKHKQSAAEAAARAEQAKLEALEAQKQNHDAACKAMLVQIDNLNGQVSKLNAEFRQRSADDAEEKRRREGELNASATMWSTERTMLQKELEQVRKQFNSEKERGNTLVAELRAARDEKSTAKAEWVALEHDLRMQLAAAQKEIRELKATIEAQRENVAEWEKRVKACNEFILRICQPKFSVVKDDEKMTPMTQAEAAAAAGTSASGFVLVPLMLMLDAYELLPSVDKKTIADKYEREKGVKK